MIPPHLVSLAGGIAIHLLFSAWIDLRAVTTAPPKPSVQTQFVLDAMAHTTSQDDRHWEQVMESLDLIFARMTDIGSTQQQLRAQVELNTQAMHQYGEEHQILQ